MSKENSARRARVQVGLVVLGLMAIAGCRVDMHIQPKVKADAASTFFEDGRGDRPAIPDTVAHGHLRTDELLYTGKINGVDADVFPYPVTAQVLERGQQRFNIYCAPCHGYTGNGNGMIVQRGFPAPTSYHADKLRNKPAGYFFDVITNGHGAMYSYAARVAPRDRWAIVAYIRALQLSEHATIADVPESDRQQLTNGAK